MKQLLTKTRYSGILLATCFSYAFAGDASLTNNTLETVEYSYFEPHGDPVKDVTQVHKTSGFYICLDTRRLTSTQGVAGPAFAPNTEVKLSTISVMIGNLEEAKPHNSVFESCYYALVDSNKNVISYNNQLLTNNATSTERGSLTMSFDGVVVNTSSSYNVVFIRPEEIAGFNLAWDNSREKGTDFKWDWNSPYAYSEQFGTDAPLLVSREFNNYMYVDSNGDLYTGGQYKDNPNYTPLGLVDDDDFMINIPVGSGGWNLDEKYGPTQQYLHQFSPIISMDVAPVPEPTSASLGVVGLGMLLLRRRRS